MSCCLYRVQYLHSSAGRVGGLSPGSLEGRVAATPTSTSPPTEVWARRGVVPGGGLGGVHVGLLLGLRDVPLVADPLVTKPVAHLQQLININQQ